MKVGLYTCTQLQTGAYHTVSDSSMMMQPNKNTMYSALYVFYKGVIDNSLILLNFQSNFIVKLLEINLVGPHVSKTKRWLRGGTVYLHYHKSSLLEKPPTTSS